MKKNIVITILIIIILGMMGYLIYNKVTEKKDSKESLEEQSNKENVKEEQILYVNSPNSLDGSQSIFELDKTNKTFKLYLNVKVGIALFTGKYDETVTAITLTEFESQSTEFLKLMPNKIILNKHTEDKLYGDISITYLDLSNEDLPWLEKGSTFVLAD